MHCQHNKVVSARGRLPYGRRTDGRRAGGLCPSPWPDGGLQLTEAGRIIISFYFRAG